jgi:hypothetical protein
MDFPTLPETTFNTQKEAYEYAQDNAREHGFAITIKHSAPQQDQYYYGCDRGSYHRTAIKIHVPEKLRKRQRTSRQLDCPYSLYIRRKRKQGWVVTERNGSHNHIPSLHQSGHSIHRRFGEKEVELITELATGNCSFRRSQILRTVKAQHPDNLSTPKDFGNRIAKAKRNKLGGLTNTEAAVEKLRDLSWPYTFRENEGAITDLMFAPPEGLAYLQRFPSVIFMDCTYQTNKEKLPLLEIVGGTNTMKNSTFAIAFALLNNEQESSYHWAINWLLNQIDKATRAGIKVILTDCDTALMNALDAVRISGKVDATNLLCIWHINKNVMEKMRDIVPAEERAKAARENRVLAEGDIRREIERVNSLWQALVNAESVEDYGVCLQSLQLNTPASFVRYVNRQWIPHVQRFVACWANRYLHLGQRASSRVESAHSKLKADAALAGTSQGNVLALVEACCAVVNDYSAQTKYALTFDRGHAKDQWKSEPFFTDIVLKIAHKGMQLVGASVYSSIGEVFVVERWMCWFGANRGRSQTQSLPIRLTSPQESQHSSTCLSTYPPQKLQLLA